MVIRTEKLGDGVDFLSIRDPRFKTARLKAAIFLPLAEKTAAKYAILPDLLTRCCALYPDMMQFTRHLNRLYGATVAGGVSRHGEHQLLSLSVSCIDNRFCLNFEDVVEEAARLLLSMLFCPHLDENGLFAAEDFEQEKRCLCERIAAEMNEKRVYARRQSDKLLANGSPYGIPVTGTAEAAAALTREAATAAWKEMLKTAKFQFVYMANDDGERVSRLIEDAFAGQKRTVDFGKTDPTFVPLSVPRRKTEQMPLKQAKLVMGFRLKAHEPDEKAVATGRMLTALFGGGPQSLLFRHVREEMSLCYYCHAVFDRHNGVLTVDSGVDPADTARAEAAILHQLDRICRGDFSEDSFDSSRRSLIHHIRDYENLQSSSIGWYVAQSLTPRFLSPAEAIDRLEAVTREDVCRLAQTVTLTSVYTLLPEGGDTE